MKKLIALMMIAGMLTFGFSNMVVAQNNPATNTEMTSETTPVEAQATEVVNTLGTETIESKGFHQVLKEQFIAGGWQFMGSILIVMILGLALSIERIIYLNLATTNNQKLLNQVESALQTGGVDSAKSICQDTKGPVASIFYQGLDRYSEGMEIVEKSIVSYGSVLMGRLEKGLSWIALFIALAPMLGFLGTVIGMVVAFQAIEAAGDISANIVAGGMKVALLTTVFGLITAIVLQVFYNYLLSKIEGLINDMEDSTITFMDILTKFKSKN